MGFENTRQNIMAEVQAFIADKHPNLDVNYPNKKLVDVETQRKPFSTIELFFEGQNRPSIVLEDCGPKGKLNFYIYYKEDTGIAFGAAFIDTVVDHFSDKTYTGITLVSPRSFP